MASDEEKDSLVQSQVLDLCRHTEDAGQVIIEQWTLYRHALPGAATVFPSRDSWWVSTSCWVDTQAHLDVAGTCKESLKLRRQPREPSGVVTSFCQAHLGQLNHFLGGHKPKSGHRLPPLSRSIYLAEVVGNLVGDVARINSPRGRLVYRQKLEFQLRPWGVIDL